MSAGAVALTAKEIDTMLHALGSSTPRATLGFRNHFCGEDADVLRLAELGMMQKVRDATDVFPDPYYRVTEQGIEFLRSIGHKVALR